ncbi:MAG: KilA-N domain-containing protein [Desulfobacterota bacterium]|jgi:hypothetical protein|nr:KilA-N domain-containing protein [Thermodesulfobacteriota bacterium]
MYQPLKATVSVKGTEITVLVHREEDYISLTDIARHRNPDHTDDLIRNWLRNRNTIESVGRILRERAGHRPRVVKGKK